MTTTRHGSATFEFTDRTVRMQRRFQAPVALVFDAMTKPEHVRVWFPADDAPLHICEIDLRVGGKYHYAWYAPGDIECSFRGTFLEIEPPTRIVATWLFDGWPDDEAVETVMLSEHDGITTIDRHPGLQGTREPRRSLPNKRWRAGQLGQAGRPAG